MKLNQRKPIDTTDLEKMVEELQLSCLGHQNHNKFLNIEVCYLNFISYFNFSPTDTKTRGRITRC